MTADIYHPQLAQTPFMLGRHGESVRNAGDMSQGQGNEEEGLPYNGLTEKGVAQAESIPPALAAAGIAVQQVNSSSLPRARETAEAFVDVHPAPKPLLAASHVPGIKEVSQKGWETIHTREEVKKLRAAALAKETERLKLAGLPAELESHIPWTTRLGRGESPLGAALRGIHALEAYGVKPGELVFSHAMLNRYMDAIATRVPGAERDRLQRMMQDGSAVGTLAVIHALTELGVPTFKTADDKRNQQANGGVTEYTVDPATGLWVAGRRIEPPKTSDTTPFVEHRRGEDDLWHRVTPGGGAGAVNNE